jgi:hypothetical protein
VSSFDSTSVVGTPRGITYAAPTAAQILAGAWIVVQESGIAQVFVNPANATIAVGNQVVASANSGAGTAKGAVATQTFASTAGNLQVGFTLALPATGITVPTQLTVNEIDD